MVNNSTSVKVKSIIMLVAAAVIWGGSFVAVKDSLDYVTPLWQLAIRLGVASLGGLAILPLQRNNISRKAVFQGVVMGIIFVCALIPQNLGAQVTTAGKCAFLTVSYVAFTPVLELVILKRGLTVKKIATIVICMTGIGFITLNERLTLRSGDIYLLLTGFFYALHIMWVDRCESGKSVLIIHLAQIFTATVIAVIAALIFEPFEPCTKPDFIMAMFYCGILEVLVGFLLQLKGQQRTNPSLAGILLSMECVYAAMFGIIFQSDVLAGKMLLGCVLVFGAAVLEALDFGEIKKKLKIN